MKVLLCVPRVFPQGQIVFVVVSKAADEASLTLSKCFAKYASKHVRECLEAECKWPEATILPEWSTVVARPDMVTKRVLSPILGKSMPKRLDGVVVTGGLSLDGDHCKCGQKPQSRFRKLGIGVQCILEFGKQLVTQ